MSEMEIFNFDDHEVRVVMIDEEPWWVLNDVCAVLGISNPRNVADRLPDDCVRQADVVDARGQMRATNVVSETGLYRVVLRSDKPEAEPFMAWATEKIKDLRRHGVATVRPMSPAEILLAQAQQLVDQERRLVQNEQVGEQHDARLQALESNYGRVSALGYAKLNQLPDGVDFLNRLGRIAGRVGREQGLPVEKAHSTVFGDVNTWPNEVWDEAVRQMS
jgi:prophage antirepressor-like protein